MCYPTCEWLSEQELPEPVCPPEHYFTNEEQELDEILEIAMFLAHPLGTRIPQVIEQLYKLNLINFHNLSTAVIQVDPKTSIFRGVFLPRTLNPFYNACNLIHEAIHAHEIWEYDNPEVAWKTFTNNPFVEAPPRAAERLIGDPDLPRLTCMSIDMNNSRFLYDMINSGLTQQRLAERYDSIRRNDFEYLIGGLLGILLSDMIESKVMSFEDTLVKKGDQPLLTKLKQRGGNAATLKHSVQNFFGK